MSLTFSRGKGFASRVAVVALLAIVQASCGRAPEVAQTPASTETDYIARVGDIRAIVPAVGEILPATEVEVSAEVSGRVIALYADFDDQVLAGQVIAELDATQFEAAVASAEADVALAQARHTETQTLRSAADREHRRIERLVEREVASEVQLRSAVDNLTIAIAREGQSRAALDASTARLASSRADLEKTQIRSPIDGYVIDRLVEVGQSLNAMQVNPVLFTVASDLAIVQVNALVSEADVGRVQEGMDVRFSVPAYPGVVFYGTSGGIRRAPVADGRFVSYPVNIIAEDPGQRLLPGMTASIEFVRADVQDALIAPIAALYFVPADYVPELPPEVISTERLAELRSRYEDPEMFRAAMLGVESGALWRRGTRRIFVRRNGDVEAVEIRVGAQGDDFFEIVSAEVNDGDRIVLAE
jgi:HlyD family secretion protein